MSGTNKSYAQRHRQLRLFISSTFVDMNKERDALVRVFPRIIDLCKERGVEFIPLDLRWGITEEAAKEGRVIETCLREIDDSRPFFIGIVGNRYGWSPSESDLGDFADDLKRKYPWIENAIKNGMSITEMEMQHAILMRSDEENVKMNAAFYLRSDKMCVEDSFKEKPGSVEEQKLNKLIQTIKSQKRFAAKSYDSPEGFANMVLEDVEVFLDREFPIELLSRHKWDVRKYERILEEKSESMIPLTRYDSQINAWKDGKTKQNFLITGYSGRGKSYLLASIVKKLREKGEKLVFFDFSEQEDNTIRSAEYITRELLILMGVDEKRLERRGDIGCLFSLVWLIIKVFFTGIVGVFRAALGDMGKAGNAMGENLVSAMSSFESSEVVSNTKHLLKLLKKNPDTVLYIVIDNIDDMTNDDINLLDLFREVKQLRLICSASTNTKAHLYIQNLDNFDSLKVENLDYTQASAYVNNYLAKYGKALDEKGEQCNRLLQSGVAGNVQFLSYILNLMVRFGSYEKIDEYITELSVVKDEKALYSLLLKNIFSQCRTSADLELTRNVLMACAVVKDGLSENEILEIFKPKTMEWSLLRPYIFSMCKNKGNLMKLHSGLCRSLLLGTFADKAQSVKNTVGEYFVNILDYYKKDYTQSNGQFDFAKGSEEREKLRRQVQVLPMLYYEMKDMEALYYWATYLPADIMFTENQRRMFWQALYKAGYFMKDIADVDVPPNVRNSVQNYLLYRKQKPYSQALLDVKQMTSKDIHRMFDEGLEKWMESSEEDKQQLYTRWCAVAGFLQNQQDIEWLADRTQIAANKDDEADAKVTNEYMKLLSQNRFDEIIEKSKTQSVGEVAKLMTDFIVVVAYHQKGDTLSAYNVAKKNIEDIRRLQYEYSPEVLGNVSVFGELVFYHGTMQDVEVALSLLKIHNNQEYLRSMDHNNAMLWTKAMALLFMKKGDYDQAMHYAQMLSSVLVNMKLSTKLADDIIEKIKKVQSQASV